MAPVNDNLPTVVSGQTFTVFGNNTGATQFRPPLPGEPLVSVWWKWRVPAEYEGQEYVATTLGSNYDTTLSVYQSVPITTSLNGSNDDFSDYLQNLWPSPSPLYYASAVTFRPYAYGGYGSTTFAVGGFGGAQGNIVLTLAKVTRGNDSNNSINGTGNNDWILGGGGNDTINGNGGRDFLFGEAGNDRLAGTFESDYLSGGDGRDVLYGNGGRDILAGGNDADTIYGGSQGDIIFGGHGNDVIYANGGGDFIDSGADFDTLWLGGAAKVVLTSGIGHDVIHNFKLGQTQLMLNPYQGMSYSGLSFTNSAEGTRISIGGELLAVVRNTSASVFINNPNIFVPFSF